jgi:hypothetical protein
MQFNLILILLLNQSVCFQNNPNSSFSKQDVEAAINRGTSFLKNAQKPDGTWSERGEYDGSEWWNYQKCPDIPSELKRVDKEREQKLNKIIDEK